MEGGAERNYRCVECAALVPHLYREYSKGNIRLSVCDHCNNVVDKYVEYEDALLCLDLMLHKVAAYRHLLYNRSRKPPQQKAAIGFILILLLESYIACLQNTADLWSSFVSGTIQPFRRLEFSFSIQETCVACIQTTIYFGLVLWGAWVCVPCEVPQPVETRPTEVGTSNTYNHTNIETKGQLDMEFSSKNDDERGDCQVRHRAKTSSAKSSGVGESSCVVGSSQQTLKTVGNSKPNVFSSEPSSANFAEEHILRMFSALVFSSFFLLFILLSVVWHYHWTHLFILRVISVSSNNNALSVFFPKEKRRTTSAIVLMSFCASRLLAGLVERLVVVE